MSVAIMEAPRDGQEPGEAWEQYRRQLIEDGHLRRLFIGLSGVTGVRKLLDESRRGWRELGFEAPFDFLLDPDGGSHGS